VFNLFEGLATDGQTEATAAGILEWLGVSFTGSPAQTLSLGRDKMLTKRLFAGSGLPTPAFMMVEDRPCPPCGIDWPVIVMPARQDGSVGIEQASVVPSQPQMEHRVGQIIERYGAPVLVEQFIRGREFHVTVIEPYNADGLPSVPMVLPLTEVVFEDKDPSVWPIYSFDAKWTVTSREYGTTPLTCPVALEPALHARLERLCGEAFRLLGCRDYARVDVRMTPEGEFYILEVNPNPFINSIAVIDGLEALGRSHAGFLADLMRRALARRTRRAGEESISVA
jgi:D-alanine-D-alanine ligase